jgi:predicted amidohydrolase YtcJ
MQVADGSTKVIDLGTNVAYPGFVDAHSHWIGDRGMMGLGTPAEAIQAALSRGWTSITETWVDQVRMDELRALDAAGELKLRVDGYLALNLPGPSGEHLGDWYLVYRPGESPSDHLRFPGVKFTIDNGWGTKFWWTADDLAAAVKRADGAGWQIASHTVSTEAHDMLLDAYEAVLAGGPNVHHHRVDHAIQVTDEQLARMKAMDLVPIVHLDGAAADWVLEADYLGHLNEPGEPTAWLARWRDMADAGLKIAGAVDAPWIFPDFVLKSDIGRPVDQIAGAMDGVGRKNTEIPAWVLKQLLTVDQALAAVTWDAAWAINDIDRRGHLAVGTYADITILSGDVTAATPDQIRRMDVIATIVGGSAAFCAVAAYCP